MNLQMNNEFSNPNFKGNNGDQQAEDQKLLSLSCWNREQCVLQLIVIISEIQESFLCIPQTQQKIQRLYQIVQHIKTQEIRRQGVEIKLINKYYSVKTDTQYQKSLMLSILEQILNNYKRLEVSYDNRLMINEQNQMKADVERLKTKLREKIKLERTSVGDILSLVSQFSRGRLEQALAIADKNSNSLRRKQNTQINQTQFQTLMVEGVDSLMLNRINQSFQLDPILKEQENIYQQYPSPRDILKQSLKGKSIDLNDIFYDQTGSKNLGRYYQGIFNKVKKRMKLGSLSTSEKAQPTALMEEVQQIFKVAHSIPLNVNKLRSTIVGNSLDSQRIIKESKLPRFSNSTLQQEFQQYTQTRSPQSNIVHCGRETYVPENQYLDIWNELRDHSEKNQLIFLQRSYKELLRANSLIIQGTDQFRRQYGVFLNHQAQQNQNFRSYRSQGQDTNQLWTQIYEQSRLNGVQPSFGTKEISLILQSRRKFTKIRSKTVKTGSEDEQSIVLPLLL